MSYYGISPQKEEELKARMQRLGVAESEIEEAFLRSSGKGGQNVNKVATCVHLNHIPTGLIVKCQQERQQGLNRYRARCLLLDKIEQRQHLIKQAAIDRKEKERRRKRRRSQTTREKMLADKRRQKERRQRRGKISLQKMNDYL